MRMLTLGQTFFLAATNKNKYKVPIIGISFILNINVYRAVFRLNQKSFLFFILKIIVRCHEIFMSQNYTLKNGAPG